MVEQNLIKTRMNLRPFATKTTGHTWSPIRICIIKFLASWFLTPSQGVVPTLSKSSTLNCGASNADNQISCAVPPTFTSWPFTTLESGSAFISQQDSGGAGDIISYGDRWALERRMWERDRVVVVCLVVRSRDKSEDSSRHSWRSNGPRSELFNDPPTELKWCIYTCIYMLAVSLFTKGTL